MDASQCAMSATHATLVAALLRSTAKTLHQKLRKKNKTRMRLRNPKVLAHKNTHGTLANFHVGRAILRSAGTSSTMTAA